MASERATRIAEMIRAHVEFDIGMSLEEIIDAELADVREALTKINERVEMFIDGARYGPSSQAFDNTRDALRAAVKSALAALEVRP